MTLKKYTEKKKPEYSTQSGNQYGLIKGAVWRNDKDGKISYTFSIQKAYKDKKTEEWKNTDTLNIFEGDLPHLKTVVDRLANQETEK